MFPLPLRILQVPPHRLVQVVAALFEIDHRRVVVGFFAGYHEAPKGYFAVARGLGFWGGGGEGEVLVWALVWGGFAVGGGGSGGGDVRRRDEQGVSCCQEVACVRGDVVVCEEGARGDAVAEGEGREGVGVGVRGVDEVVEGVSWRGLGRGWWLVGGVL